jgi:c(7)-type cytochrome triheme protein
MWIRLVNVITLLLLALTLPALAQEPSAVNTPKHKPLAEDGLHDPSLPAIEILQEPGEVLGALPSTTSGNMVDWNKAVRDGYIQPRATLEEQGEVETLDLDIYFPNTAGADVVRFPHREHTEWLDCSNCHPFPFAEKAGATPVSMLQILMGEYCGRCHGAVSFPLTECSRCHSVSYEEYRKIREQQEN